jgi:hypothetical protein
MISALPGGVGWPGRPPISWRSKTIHPLRAFYGQSASLVRWLIARKDAPTFIRFLRQCPEGGMAAALERHYGLRSIKDLELAWKEVPPMQTFGLAGLSP